MTSLLLLPVLSAPNLRAWPKHDDGGRALYQPARVALEEARYATDAHTAGYSAPSVPRRLDKGAPGHDHNGAPLVVPMVVQFVDVDGPNHKPTNVWRAEENAKIARLFEVHPGFAFHSRGGYKLAWRRAVPFLVTSDDDAARWRLHTWRTLLYLSRRFGIEGDPACSDWTRLFRLPHATRPTKIDGSEIPGTAPEELPVSGDPELAAPFAFEPDPADLAADLAEARRLHQLHPAQLDSDGKTKVAGPWSAAVKALALAAGEAPAPPAPKPPPRNASQPRGSGRPSIEERARLWCERMLENLAADVARAGRGTRNSAARDAALILGHYAPRYLNPDNIARELLAACERNGLVRDDGREAARATIERAINDGMREPKRPELPDDEPRPAAGPRKTTQSTAPEGGAMDEHEHQEHDNEETTPLRPDEPLKPLDPWKFNVDDTGNGERFRAHHGADVRYCHPWQKWLVWDGRRWRLDDCGDVRHRAKRTARGIYDEAARITATTESAEARRKALATWAGKSASRDRRAAMVELAQVEPGIPILPEKINKNPWLLTVENGTVDLQTGKLRPHRRQDLITQLAPVAYDPAAECPLFLTFLGRITGGNEGLATFLQRFLGYALTGVIREHVLVMAWGNGSNGKSTLLKTFLGLLGDYAYQAPADLIMAKKNEAHPTDQAGLFGRRFVVCMETPEGRAMDETRMKALTGGDLVTARRMHEDFWSFEPTHKLVLGTNHKPMIRTTDHGTWRRQKLVPFTTKIPDHEQDKALPEKLRAEFPGILRWAVEGCLAWQREGLGEPPEITKATDAWRNESDPLAGFLAAECELGEEYTAEAAALYLAFERYARETSDEVLTKQAFGRRLTERGMVATRTKKARGWLGLRLRAEAEGCATGEGGGDPKPAPEDRVTMTVGDAYSGGLSGVNKSSRGEPRNKRHQPSSVTSENEVTPTPQPPASGVEPTPANDPPEQFTPDGEPFLPLGKVPGR